MATKKKTNAEKLICSVCNKEKNKDSGFYNSHNELFKSIGKIPICKQCLKDMIDYNNMDSVYKVLRQIDVKFDHGYWGKAERSKNDTFARYMTMANSLHQFEGTGWDDSIFENNEIENNNNHIGRTEQTTFIINDEIVDKWGVGYSPIEYEQFEKKYKRLINNYGEKTALHTEGLITYIRYRVKEELATAQGNVKEAKEWGTLASNAGRDAKINVSQLSKSDISGGVDVLSQLFEAVENEASVIPLLPKLIEQPYDDADLIIWATVNYNRRLDDKSPVAYKDIWNFYDEMLNEYLETQGYSEEMANNFKEKRITVFRDLGNVYVEPLYNDEGED